jgi:putative chitinase
MIQLTRDQIKAIAPRANERALDALVNGFVILASAGINTSKLRLAHALAQWAYETNGFVEWSENLHYSAQRLLQVFPRYFTHDTAEKAAHEGPEAIANIVYDDRNPVRRNKLGNTHDGDGWRFRGRGVMHTTGREGYARATAVTGVDLIANPDALADPALSLVVACRYWLDRGCNAKADADDIDGVTRIINGGLNGIDGRREYLAKAKHVLSGASEVPAAAPHLKSRNRPL